MSASYQQLSAADPAPLARLCFERPRRLLLLGQPGIGKTTLAAKLAAHLAATGETVHCLSADPGSPAFGVPGAVCLGAWRDQGWLLSGMQALCALDAARFRLPLVSAVRRLATTVSAGNLLLDAPGVVRGVAGAELLEALVEAAAIDLVLILQRTHESFLLRHELHHLPVEALYVQAATAARRPGKQQRARQRTRLWDRYLERSETHRLARQDLRLLGTPPRQAPQAWEGKQVAFLQREHTLAMGEVTAAQGETLEIRLPAGHRPSDSLLVRDAGRDAAGLLTTGKPFADKQVRYFPPPDLVPDAAIRDDGGVRPMAHTASAVALLVNGVFGDPLLHLRLRHQRRSLLFDLGEGSRLPARIAHQVSDVFITHAHVDHIGGFLWLLRSRIGEPSRCRLYGPPGLARHIQGLIDGICWDRIGDRGPRFEVMEVHDTRVRRFRLQAGQSDSGPCEERPLQNGVLRRESAFQVRTITLDHGIPVMAFAFEPAKQFKVRKERLLERQLTPGPWLNRLKQHLYAGERDAVIALPDGDTERADRLAEDLILVSEAHKLVYATDFADTPANRRRLTQLARDAHTLFCESSFLQQDRDQARRTGHLTTRACAEIAHLARVKYLIPFHFSCRYEDRLQRVYEEIAAVCPAVVMPKQPAD